MSRRYHVFVNDAAGSVGEIATQLAEITKAFADVGVDVTTEAVSADALPEAMRRVWQSGLDAVVVAGGDGTVNCGAQAAVENDIVLGVLPLGTFNHFAKDLGMIPALDTAAQFLASAEVTIVDVGDVNGRVFVNNASIGVYPKMVDERDELRARRGWSKLRAAPVAIVRTLRGLPVLCLRLTIDGGPTMTVETPLMFVGNGLFDEHGQRLGRRTSLSDHRLGVYVIATSSRWRLIANAVRARLGGVHAAPGMVRHAAEELIVDSPDPTLLVALDGERTELGVPLTFRSRPGALRVLASPARTEGSGTPR